MKDFSLLKNWGHQRAPEGAGLPNFTNFYGANSNEVIAQLLHHIQTKLNWCHSLQDSKIKQFEQET